MFEIEDDVPPPTGTTMVTETFEKPPRVDVMQTFDNQTSTGVVLNNWKHAKEKYDEAKAVLDEAKKSVISHIGENISAGTNRFATGFYVLKAVKAEKIDVEVNDVNALNQTLAQLVCTAGMDVAREIIQWKPSLNKKLYDNLRPEERALLAPFLKLSYGSPTLTIEKL